MDERLRATILPSVSFFMDRTLHTAPADTITPFHFLTMASYLLSLRQMDIVLCSLAPPIVKTLLFPSCLALQEV